MPSGKKDIYGTRSKSLYKAGTVAMEKAAAENRKRLKLPMPKEGITRRPEVIRTTTAMKPTPMGGKK